MESTTEIFESPKKRKGMTQRQRLEGQVLRKAAREKAKLEKERKKNSICEWLKKLPDSVFTEDGFVNECFARWTVRRLCEGLSPPKIGTVLRHGVNIPGFVRACFTEKARRKSS